MGCLHPGWSWLSSLLPVGPVYSYLCQGGEDGDKGGKAREDGQPGGEGGSASTQAEEQREEEKETTQNTESSPGARTKHRDHGGKICFQALYLK